MKYLLITLEYLPFYGGVAHYYGNLVKYFPAKLAVIDNSQNRLVNKKLLLKWWPAIKTVWQAVKKDQVNYILVGHILPLGTVAWLLSRVLSFKYCLIVHGDDLNYAMRQPRKARLALKILDKSDKIICANHYIADKVKKIIDQKQLGKVKVVNPGVGARPAYNEPAVKKLVENYDLQAKTIVFSVGRLIERKGMDLVIKSMPSLIKAVPNLEYYIAGTGPDEEYLKDLVKALPSAIRQKVHFLGKISETVKWQWLDVCHMLAMPARAIGDDIEGFGIVYLEANLAGKPVIAGRSGGVSDAVEDNVNGFLIKPDSQTELVEAVTKLANYQGLAQRLGDQGRQRTRHNFAWPNQAKKIYQIISK